MILCIEYWNKDTYLTGKAISQGELAKQMKQVEACFDPQTDNFIPLLCRMYGWEPIDCLDVVPDITYDRDTGILLQHNL